MRHPLSEPRRRAALELVCRVLGERPTIVAEEPLGPELAPVTRLTLDRELPGIGRSVVVKTRRVEGAGHGGPEHLRREHAGLCTAAAAHVTPHLVGADHAAGVVVTADLGSWPTVEAILLGDDGDAAARAMVELGRAVGRLHAATLGAAASHREALIAAGARDAVLDLRPETRPAAGIDPVVVWDAVERACAEHGLPAADTARDEVAEVLARVAEPSPFAGLVHMDLNPTNAVVTDDGVKLVDFESSVFGHLGIDTCYLHYPFPTFSMHWATLPEEVVTAADRAYRDALAPALPAGAIAGYDDMLATGAAAVLAVRVQRLGKLAEPDQPAHERWRRRAQLVQQIRVFERLAAAAGCWPALAGWFAQLADAMADRWVDATAPPPALFPAFRRSRSGG